MKIITFFIILLMFVIHAYGFPKYNHKFNTADSGAGFFNKTSSLQNVNYLSIGDLSLQVFSAGVKYQELYSEFPLFFAEVPAAKNQNETMMAGEITMVNHMVDGSFDSWNYDSKTPVGMSTFANGGSYTYEHSNDAKMGTKSFKALSASTTSSYTFSFTDITRNSGDKIYFGAWIKTSKRISSGYLSDHSGYMTIPSKSDTWEWCSYITSSTATKTGLQFRLNKPDKKVGDYIMLDGVFYINLTQVFGAGAEPDILDLDMFVRNHDYFNASDPQAINNFINLIENYKKTDPILQARQTRLSNNTLRVGTYNTKSGFTQFNLTRKNIADMNLDLIGLQEVAEPYDQSKSFNNLISNYNLSHSHHFPIKRTTYDYGIVGIGIGSAFPLIDPTSIPDDYNGCIKTVVKFGGKNVSFYNTHLKVPDNNTEAKTYIDKLWNNIISKDTAEYIIVTADFNAPKGTADLGIFQSFVDNGFNSAQGPAHGWYSTYIGRNDLWIDNVLVKGFKILNTGIKNPSVASDHNAFWAEIQMISDSKIDQTLPVLKNVPADKNLGNNPKLPSCDANVTVTGGCSETTVACTPGSIIKDGCKRSQTFIYTATDACGNKDQASTTYTWTEDLTPPVLANVPADKNLGNNPELPSCDAKVTASDQCSNATVTCSPGTIIKDGCNRSQTFTYTATDASGNKATAKTTYTWTEDLTTPVLSNVPADKYLGNNPELPSCDAKVTATGGCSEATVVCTPGTIIKDGCNRSQTFTYTTTDATGNKATAKTTYTWTEDLTTPVLSNVPADKYLGKNPELPSCDANVTAADQCSEATVSCTPGTITLDGHTRTQIFHYTATDASGNSVTATTTYTWTAGIPAPVADFTATENILKEGETVQIEDLSDNNPVSWSWKFEGGTPGTSALRNPVVRYHNPGKYSVTLTVANASGSDTKSVENFITVEEYDELTTGVEKEGQPLLFRLYPNPASKNIVLEMNPASTGFIYTVYDMTGRKLKTDKILSERTTIDLSEQLPGFYLMVIKNGNQLLREMIVKQ